MTRCCKLWQRSTRRSLDTPTRRSFMRNVHLPMRIGFAALLGVIGYLGIQREVRATPGDVKVIAPGVWFREGEIKDKGHCNNIWIEMKDYVIVVDANFPSGAQACLL